MYDFLEELCNKYSEATLVYHMENRKNYYLEMHKLYQHEVLIYFPAESEALHAFVREFCNKYGYDYHTHNYYENYGIESDCRYDRLWVWYNTSAPTLSTSKLLDTFENLVILKTIMDSVDLDYLSMDNLIEIAGYAEEFNIDMNIIDIDDVYNHNSEYLIYQVYNQWLNNVNLEYLKVKNDLLKQI